MRRRSVASRVPHVLLAVAGLGLGLVACSGARTEGLDPSKLPENIREDYQVFARRCSKCHSLARPLTAGITDDDEWVNYVNRMRRQPGSGISRDDQDHILRFLRYYAAELRRRDAAKKGTTPAPPSAAPSTEPPPERTPPAPPPPVSPETPPSAPPADAPRRNGGEEG